MSLQPVTLPRRLASCVYDGLLALGIAMLSALITSAIGTSIYGTPSDLEGVWSIAPDAPIYQAFQTIMLAISLGLASLFYLYFWWRRGQTLGMVSWRIRVSDTQGQPITLRRAILRFVAVFISLAPLGLGFWWSLLEPDGRCWHDRISGTLLSYEPKPAKKA